MNEPPAPPASWDRLDLSQRLGIILTVLRAMLAARAGRDHSVAPLVVLAWGYLGRLARRFEALARRVRAGDPTLTSPRQRTCAAPAERPERPEPRPRPPGLPRTFAWMVRLTQNAASSGSQLHYLLTDPEFATFLAAAPQAGRLLRPLCRALGISRNPDLPAALFETPDVPRPTRRGPKPPAAPSPAPPRDPDRRVPGPSFPGELTREDILSWPGYRDLPA